jgi:acyl-CoA reductase-like NAD-dependent aldehyde dehydrogenase
VCTNRILVHKDIAEAFAAKLAVKIQALVVGDGKNNKTTQGPLINEAAVRKVEDLISDATQKGAKVDNENDNQIESYNNVNNNVYNVNNNNIIILQKKNIIIIKYCFVSC